MYKYKEKMVEQPHVLSSIPPKEEKKPMLGKPAPTQTKINNRLKWNQSARECRHRHRAIARMLQMKEDNNNIENKNPNLPEAMHDDSIPWPQHKQELSMEIVIWTHVVINLDYGIDITKIDSNKCIMNWIHHFPLLWT